MAATHATVWQRARVRENAHVATDIRRIGLEVDRPIKVDAGAHLDVRIRIGGETDTRSYSIVDAAADGSQVAVSVYRSPLSRGGADVMHALSVGDEVEITQPKLDFPLRIGAPSYVLLAGGIGITAILSMASALRAVGARYRLIYAGRTRAAMAYLDQLAEEHGEALEVHVREEGTSLQVPEMVAALGGDVELYMCGPIRLMDSVRRSWIECGRRLPNLRFETFGNSGWFDAQEFSISVPRLGIETVVRTGETMLEALEAAGADMMYDCRKGECGLCEVRVIAFDGAIDHRDVFYSERQKDATGKMCCCVSRVVATGTVFQGRVVIETS